MKIIAWKQNTLEILAAIYFDAKKSFICTKRRMNSLQNRKPQNIQSPMLHNLVAPGPSVYRLDFYTLTIIFFHIQRKIFLPFGISIYLHDFRRNQLWPIGERPWFGKNDGRRNSCTVPYFVQFNFHNEEKNIMLCQRNRKCQCSLVRQKMATLILAWMLSVQLSSHRFY